MAQRNITNVAIVSFALVATVFALVTVARADENVTPPSTTVTIWPPLTTGPNSQHKTGSLSIGPGATGASKLCLNGSGDNCITAWSDITNKLPSFVRLRTSGVSLLYDDIANYLPALDYTQYTPQANHAAIQSLYKNIPENNPDNDNDNGYQAYAAVISAPVLNACDYGQDDQSGFCAGTNLSKVCYTNNDCGLAATAVRGVGTNVAHISADFQGTVYVRSTQPQPSMVIPWAEIPGMTRGRICLNGVENPTNEPEGGSCISSWNEVSGTSTNGYVQRRPTIQTSQIGRAAITGDSQFGSAVVGSAVGLLPQYTKYTCGDGMCNGSETATDNATHNDPNFCPIDCFVAPGTPLVSAGIDIHSYNNPTVFVSGYVGEQAGDAYIVIVRSTSATPGFRPLNGSTYTKGQAFGTDVIVFAGSQVPSSSFLFGDDTVPIDQNTYYYAMYQSHYSTPTDPPIVYPRYGSPAVAQVKIAIVTVTMNKPAGFIGPEQDPSFLYQCSGTVCHGLYNVAMGSISDTIVLREAMSGYVPNGWSGCATSTLSACSFSTDRDKPDIIFNVVPSKSNNLGGAGG